MKLLTTIFLITIAGYIHAQQICSLSELNFDSLKISASDLIRVDTTIDKTHYNCKIVCPEKNYSVMGNIDKNGKKRGHWIFYNSKGEFIVQGDYKNDLRDGLWWNNGCCTYHYKQGKLTKYTCVTL